MSSAAILRQGGGEKIQNLRSQSEAINKQITIKYDQAYKSTTITINCSLGVIDLGVVDFEKSDCFVN